MSSNQVLIVLILVLASLILGFFLRSVWGRFSGEAYIPHLWKESIQLNKIPESLQLLEKIYPDRMRFYTIWFQLHRIHEEQVPGDLAELGVYKGESARLIRYAAPGRTLHLFDTFEGFPAKDLEVETGEAASYTINDFADTHEAKVLQTIGLVENVIIHKGYFPETTSGLDDLSFAFVSIDVDLYQPTMAGLRYFYPRLSPGAALIIHDHNHVWPGVMRAVREFQASIPENFILIPDKDSSMMLIRNR